MRTSTSVSVIAMMTALAVAAPSAHAQAVTTGTEEGATASDIVVTARRVNENIQDVPMAITAVTGDAIEDLNFFSFQDVAAIAPGLDMDAGTGGFTASASLRGVTFEASSGANPTVDLYLNEVPIGADYAFQSIYDVGQVEILRGPQGTLRGRPSPSGAITLTTKRPHLSEFGGTMNFSGTSRNQIRGEAAVNVPIVRDMLAVRLAGVIDHNDFDGVRSVNNGKEPFRETRSFRGSVAFAPTDNLRIDVMYQDLKARSQRFEQVVGNGYPGPFPQAGFNGPPLTVKDRAAVASDPSTLLQTSKLLVGQAVLDLGDFKLSYVGGYHRFGFEARNELDPGNFLLGASVHQDLRARGQKQHTEELRLEGRVSDFWDFGVGLFYLKGTGITTVLQPAAFLPGAFGSPGGIPNINAFNPRFVYDIDLGITGVTKSKAIFANSTFHITDRTDLFVGARYQQFESLRTQDRKLVNGLISTSIGLPAGFCGFAGFGETYPGFCDVPLPDQQILNYSNAQKHKPWVYNASLTHRFTPDITAYASFGHSWREGSVNIGVDSEDPVITAFTVLEPETSDTFEVGVKSQWLDRRLTLNVAAFYQKFKNFIYTGSDVPYLNRNGQVATADFLYNADAGVKGFDIDVSFRATPNWSVSGSINYADGKLSDDQVPCRDVNFDGTRDSGSPTAADFQNAGRVISFCKSDESTSRQPKWGATLQSEISFPVGGSNGYVRGLLNYKPKNPRAEGVTVKAYTLLNLYTGVRGEDADWDIGLFAKNLLNTRRLTSRDVDQLTPVGGAGQYFGTTSTGYFGISQLARREFGLSIRYSWGS